MWRRRSRSRGAGLDLTVRGGGHNFSGSAVIDGALMVDLSLMRAVQVDAPAKRATVEGGATWADLDAGGAGARACDDRGLHQPHRRRRAHAGRRHGWLTRKAGLSVDNLLGAQIVTADGQVLHASADENPDLFWAIRGGGGNLAS